MKSLILKIVFALSGPAKAVLAFLLPILEDNTAKLLAALLPIALDAVASLMDSPKSGAEKRAAAVDAIKAQAIHAGVDATASAVNLAVELAVQKLNPGQASGSSLPAAK